MTKLNPFDLTAGEVVTLLLSTNGAKILSFVARTDAGLKKTGNPYKGVVKVAKVNALVNFHYDAGVTRRLAQEGKSLDDFKKGSSWHLPLLKGDHLTPFATHPKTGELYLRVLWLSTVQETYFDENGTELTREQVAEWLPKTVAYANQGLDNPLRFLTYKLANVKEITLDGNTYFVAA